MGKKCVIWGTRAAGKQLARQAVDMGYNVFAFCSSTKETQKNQIDNHPVISPEELARLYSVKEVDTVFLGVKNPSYRKEIEELVKQLPPLDFSVISQETDLLEQECLERAKERLSYQWDVSFEEQAELWLQNFMGEVESWVRDDALPDGFYHDVYLQRLENTDFLGIDTSCEEVCGKLCAGSAVMDIGCGLVSMYGSRLPNGEEIKLLAVDPLAPFYNKINQIYGGKKAKECQFGLFEFIANFYEENTCDAILINNALDHCIDPFKSVLECLYILKSGGVMRLKHRRAEAEYEAYHGLHKWNIDCGDQNELIFWNQRSAVNVSKELGRVAEIRVFPIDKRTSRVGQTVVAEVIKKCDFQLNEFFDMKKECRQLASLVEGLMRCFAERSQTYLSEL